MAEDHIMEVLTKGTMEEAMANFNIQVNTMDSSSRVFLMEVLH